MRGVLYPGDDEEKEDGGGAEVSGMSELNSQARYWFDNLEAIESAQNQHFLRAGLPSNDQERFMLEIMGMEPGEDVKLWLHQSCISAQLHSRALQAAFVRE